jgi:hypothetical protein
MAHWSEGSRGLEIDPVKIDALSQLDGLAHDGPGVYLFWLPFPRTSADAADSRGHFEKLAKRCAEVEEASVVCVLTTPPDAALLLPYLERGLKFQLWVALKTKPGAYAPAAGAFENRHAALLVLTKYGGPLRHTKTRVQYTYCPVCGKTTKDYGGKKHTYHEYGTMLSDVWRDIECDPAESIDPVVERLKDLFGLEPYRRLRLFDARGCEALRPAGRVEVVNPAARVAAERPEALFESRLVNGDCLEALRDIPDDSIDFCFADPPYNLKKKYDHWDDALESIKYFEWCDRWLSELCRVLKPGGTLAVLNIPLWAVRHYQHLSSFMNFQAWVAWDGLSFPVRMIMPAHYAVVCFSKGEPLPLPGLSAVAKSEGDAEALTALNETYCLRAQCVSRRRRSGQPDRSPVNDLWHDVHRLKHNSRRVDHPCQLPPALMRRLFALFTRPGEVVLDCFNGAGTSTLVAQQMGRRFVGIELSRQYHELALLRHEQLARGADPFGKVGSVPAAKNSPVQRMPKQKYEVSKKALQLDVKRIAGELGRLPTREEVRRLSRYPIEYFESYFVSWGEVCAAARTTGMSENSLTSLDRGEETQPSLYPPRDL